MSEDKRKTARTQGRFSGGDREYTSRRQDKQSSKMPSPTDKNKGEKRKAPSVGPRVQNEVDLQYEEDNKYSFQEYEPVRKPQELRFTAPVLELSETDNGISRLIYDSNFMKMAEADEYMTILESSTKWHDKNIVIKGVEYPQPRLVAWYGPHPYTYAGATLEASEIPPVIRDIKVKVEASLTQYGINVELNSVLLNLYRNEKDSVAWHSDDEFSLGVCPTIASISLGATRKFEMRPKAHVRDADTNDIYVNLTHGSLIVMDGCMQKDWQHRVPKEYHDKKARINLTFRTIYPIDQLPPRMPRASNMKSAKSPSTKEVVHQQDHQFDTENFPPLGMETSDKKSKLLPKEKGGKDYQQPVIQRKSQKEKTWNDEMLQSVEGSEETPKIQNNLNKKSSYDPIINSSELQPSQIDFNSNIKESAKMYNSKLSSKEYLSDSSETSQSHNFESNEAYELQSKDQRPSENKPVKMKTEPVEVNARTANSGKKYMLNVDAPEYVPQNKFEKYSLSELAEYCRNSDNVGNEDLQNFTEVFFKCVHENKSLFITRDLYELEVYDKLNDGSLSDKHLKIVLERISSMITNAYYKKNDSRYNNRYSNENYRKPRQSYTRSHRY